MSTSTSLVHRPFLSRPILVVGASLISGVLFVGLLWSPWDRPAAGQTRPLVLHCAAGMSKPVQELLEDYEATYGVKVEVSFDGSGKLLAKIRADGGKGDLYLAADASHIRQAQRLKLVEEVLPVAILKPVVAVNAKTHERLEKAGKPLTSAKDLLRGDLRVVLANPELASVGQLGKQLLEPSGIWKQLEKNMQDRQARVSTVGTVQEVALILQTREDYVGILWSANAQQLPDLYYFTPPEFALAQEQLQIGVLTGSGQPAAALKLARYLTAADRGGKVFAKHHFDALADADSWEEKPTLNLAAGAMLKPALDDVLLAFGRREGVKVNTKYDGCGHLVSMMNAIKSGDQSRAFPDAYFSCDLSFLEQVQPWFEPGRTVAQNDMVLLVAKGNPHGIKRLEDLAGSELRVGLGHPTHSALGKLTEDLLQQSGWYEKIYDVDRKMPVQHADAGHLLVAKMRVGALDAAVVYRSNALSHPSNVADHLDIVDLQEAGAFARQPFAVAKDSPRRHLARRLQKSLQTPAAANRFRELGFKWLLEVE